MAMNVTEVAKRFKVKWSRYTYYWNTYIDISQPMDMYCSLHGVFSLMPISHYRNKPCPQCQTLFDIRDNLEQGTVSIEDIATEYNVEVAEVRSMLGRI